MVSMTKTPVFWDIVYVQEVMATSDVAVLWDSVIRNPGFIVLRPTNGSKLLYRTVRSITSSSTKTNDMKALNRAIDDLRKRKTAPTVTLLDKKRFVGGLDYFEKARRWFAPSTNEQQTCTDRKQQRSDCAVVVHNTWIVGKAAKVYRFRENLMWVYDGGDDQYYTSSTRRYMTYANHGLASQRRTQSEKSEISALKTAMTIGHLLNRTVILPRFHQGPKATECPLNSLLHVRSFDSRFAGRYRESSFLRNPKVPTDVKAGLSKTFAVTVNDDFGNSSATGRNVTVSGAAIVSEFGDVADRVLVFGSLCNVRVLLGNSSCNTAFNKKLREAFFRSNYKQLKRSVIN